MTVVADHGPRTIAFVRYRRIGPVPVAEHPGCVPRAMRISLVQVAVRAVKPDVPGPGGAVKGCSVLRCV